MTIAARVTHNVAALIGLPSRRKNRKQERSRVEEDAVLRQSSSSDDHERWPTPSTACRKGGRRHSLHTKRQAFATMSSVDWLNVLYGALAVFTDHFDLAVQVVAMTKLAQYYNSSYSTISSAMTFALLARSAGALIFAFTMGTSSSSLATHFGSRVALALSSVMMGATQIVSIYMTTADDFFFTRGVMGLEASGVAGSVAMRIVGACPAETQTMLRCAYDVVAGLAFAVACTINWTAGDAAYTWKRLFWTAAGLSFLTAIVRLLTPEQQQERDNRLRRAETARETTSMLAATRANDDHARPAAVVRIRSYFQRSAISSRKALKIGRTICRTEWRTLGYLIIVVTLQMYAHNMLFHVHFTFLQRAKRLHLSHASLCALVGRIGGMCGSVLGVCCAGWMGTRRTMVLCLLTTCILTPAAMLTDSVAGLCIGGFAAMLMVFSGLALLPRHLLAVAPSAYRDVMPLVAYHIGSALASPAMQLANLISDQIMVHVIMRGNAYVVPAYSTVLLIIIASACLLGGVWLAVGPDRWEEARGALPIDVETTVTRTSDQDVEMFDTGLQAGVSLPPPAVHSEVLLVHRPASATVRSTTEVNFVPDLSYSPEYADQDEIRMYLQRD